MTTITCLLCGKQLDPVVPNNQFYGEMGNDANVPNVQPYGGVMFVAEGNYGSTVHDPIEGGNALVAIVCDECLLAHQDRFSTLPNDTPETEEEGRCICCDGDGVVFMEMHPYGEAIDDFSGEQVPCPCCKRRH